MKLPEIAVRRPVTITMIFSAIALIGIVGFLRLNLDMLPEIEPPAISVITPYPGASATDVESEVTKYLEDQLSTTPDLDRIESTSKDNISIINCIFNWGSDLDVAVNDIREKIDLAKSDLAAGSREPFILKFSSSMVPVLVATVTAKESLPDLYRIVDKQIADPLKRIKGVGSILFVGGKERQINIYFNREALEAYNLSIQQIRQILMAENLDAPAGSVKLKNKELQIRVAGRFKNTDEIANIVVGKNGDAFIRLKDIAEIDDNFEEPQEWCWAEGLPAMVMLVQKQSGANAVNVIDAINKKLEDLKTQLPADIETHLILDTSGHIKNMIKALTQSAFAGGILVIIICFIFLRTIITSFLVTLAIPLSILACFAGLYFKGYTLNAISLMSLALAMGMVVDDAIVVIDNIARHLDEGEDMKSAAVSGSSEVGMAVLASSLSIIAVFLPLLFVKGIAGIVFGQLSFMIILAIAMSNIVALTLIPMASSRLLHRRNEKAQNKLFAWSEEGFNQLENGYAYILDLALRYRKSTLFCAAILFFGSLLMITKVGTNFFPEMDSGDLEIVLEMPEGTRGEVTSSLTAQVLNIFDKRPEIETSYSLAGQTKDGFLTAVGFDEGTNIGRIGGRLIPKEKRDLSSKEVVADFRKEVEKIPGIEKYTARATSAIQQAFFGSGRAVCIEIMGHDIEATNAIAEKVRLIVFNTEGTEDVSVTRKKPRPEIQVKINRDKAASLGLNVGIIADVLRTNYYGFDSTKFREAGDDFDIELRLKQEERRSIAQIGEIPIMTLSGQTVKLRSVADIIETFGPVEIKRKNRVRITNVIAGVSDRFLGDIVSDIKKEIEKLDIPPGIFIQWGGEVEEQRKAFRDLALLLILGTILVYMVMAGQFEDFTDPFIIMFSLPFAYVGVIWAFVFTSTPLNIISFIGIIMLTGIVVKNAIVLVAYIKQLVEKGKSLNDAVIAGGRRRLRPVLMTGFTTVFGMVPLVLSRGEGAELWNTLGITVIGGLLMSGFVTLILVPLLYFIVHSPKKEERSVLK